MVLGMGIDVVVLSSEAWDVFQYWPNTGPESNDDRPVELTPEKSKGSDELIEVDILLSKVYESMGYADFMNSVIGESGLSGCATPLCGTPGWGLVMAVGVIMVAWHCELATAVGNCEPMSADGFIVGNCANPLCGTPGWGLVTAVRDCKPTGAGGFIVVAWHCELVMAVRDCEPTGAGGFIVVAWHCKLVMAVVMANGSIVTGFGLATAVELTATGDGFSVVVWSCGLANFFAVLVSEMDEGVQSDARLCRSSTASTPISFIQMI
jgi:hypothetical protein